MTWVRLGMHKRHLRWCVCGCMSNPKTRWTVAGLHVRTFHSGSAALAGLVLPG
jgi:hypothetical protein